MKKLILALFLGILMTATASAAGIGFGAYGGMSIPIVQEDQGNGTVFGVKAKFKMIGGISVEPNINFVKYGEADFGFGARDGSKVSYYGLDLLLGGMGMPVGPRFYIIGGAALYSVTRDNDEDASDFGLNGGLGIEIGFGGPLALDIRGKGHVIIFEGASKKFATITGGLNYYFGM